MTVDLENGNLVLRLWFMTHHTHDMLKLCEDRVFSEYKITTEQYVVLVTIKYLEYLNGHVKPTDIGRWLARSTNSISMIADRMVKGGLIRRVRDRKDRRVVWLVITNKGEEALKPATLAGLKFIQEILSSLSYEDKQTLLSLLLKVQYKAHKYLNPGADIEELTKYEAKCHDKLLQKLVNHHTSSTPEAKPQGDEKEKTI
jgi:DNA-binding MarR family transcriptional regulator